MYVGFATLVPRLSTIIATDVKIWPEKGWESQKDRVEGCRYCLLAVGRPHVYIV